MADGTKKTRLKVRIQKIPKIKKETGHALKEAGQKEKLKESIEKRINKGNEKLSPFNQEERTGRDKKLMMWAGVSFFMILILAFWILNIKSVFKGAKEARENPQKFEWNKITNEFDQTIEQIKKGLNELKQVSVTDNISTTTEDSANTNNLLPRSEDIGSSSPRGVEPGDEENLEELKVRLKELEGKIENKN